MVITVLVADGRTVDGIIQDLITDEGFRSKIYYCSKGKPTIGYGFNLDVGFSERESRAILVIRVNDLSAQISSRFKNFQNLSQTRKDVLVNMAYNLGVNGLFKFKKLFKALENDDYTGAASEIMDSQAARCLTKRYARLAKKMLFG